MVSNPVSEDWRLGVNVGVWLAGAATGRAAETPRRASACRILVVEDEMLIQMLAAEILEELGFNAETAGSAAEAKSKLSLLKGEVDAVILDIGLPDARGDVMLGEIRAAYPALPVLITSGQDEAGLRTQFVGLERVGFLSKPYVLGQLRSALASVGVVAATP
jgi:DNA-binding response OmpR family regulator